MEEREEEREEGEERGNCTKQKHFRVLQQRSVMHTQAWTVPSACPWTGYCTAEFQLYRLQDEGSWPDDFRDSFSLYSPMKRKWKCQLLSPVQLFVTMICSPPGSSVHRILQARILKWVAIPFSRSSWPRYWTWVSCITGEFFTFWAIREAPATLQGNDELDGR